VAGEWVVDAARLISARLVRTYRTNALETDDIQINDQLIFVGVLERYDTLRSWDIIRDLRVWFIREQAYKSAPPELRVPDRCISIASSFTNKKNVVTNFRTR
jgi:hypothetical protein